MKKIVCGFVFGLMLMVTGAQAWADGGTTYPPVPPNPKASDTAIVLADGGTTYPPVPNPKLA